MYILSFDQGTTGSRAIVFDKQGKPLAQNYRSHEQIYPQPGWVSHNAKEIYFNVIEAGRKAIELAGLKPSDISAIGITNQRETLVAWDKDTGEPVCDAVVWQCRRSAGICEELKNAGFAPIIREKTGLVIDAYFSATKIMWILREVEKARVLLQQGRLYVGTMDSYLLFRLTGEFVTDYTNASRTMLFNIKTLEWDKDLLDFMQIPVEILPRVVPSSGLVAYTKEGELGASIPVTGIAGDQHAALFGQMCFREGDAKNTYGTGCFILKNIGDKPIITDSNILTTIAWHINGKPTYALEGSVFNAGAAIEWLINKLRLVDTVEEINEICHNTKSTEGVHFVPALSGLGAPYWDMYARGLISGMSLSSGKEHIVRAVMEAIAFQSRDVLECMNQGMNEQLMKDGNGASGFSINSLKADGGVCKSDFIMQFQSDILGLVVERPKKTEITALGAAALAGLSTVYKDMEEIRQTWELDRAFSPKISADERESAYKAWQRAVLRARS